MEVASRYKLLLHCLQCLHCYTPYTVYIVLIVYIASTTHTVFTVYTIQAALHCSSIYAYLYCKGRLERYWKGLISF